MSLNDINKRKGSGKSGMQKKGDEEVWQKPYKQITKGKTESK